MRLRAIALLPWLFLFLIVMGTPRVPAARTEKRIFTALVLLKDGQRIEGAVAPTALRVVVGGKTVDLSWSALASFHCADPASDRERERITLGLQAILGVDRKAREAAVEELTDLGLPVLSPLLAAYKDTDIREPNPLYRLFARLLPCSADGAERGLDLIRMNDGESMRAKLTAMDFRLTPVGGREVTMPSANLRRLAIRQNEISRTFDVHSLRHCNQIEQLDSGIAVTRDSKLESTARGFVRLSFDVDGWASDADGLKVPGPNYKTNLVNGFPFGALLAKSGVNGPSWLAGRLAARSGLEPGRLYFAVNDNGHWQNNIGAFRVKLHVTNAYDLGEAL